MDINRKYNILHVVANLAPGGAELRLMDYLGVADRERFDHHVACVTTARSKDMIQSLHDMGIPLHVPGRAFRYDPRLPLRLAAIMRNHSIDLVHSRNATANIWAGAASMIAGVRVFVAAEHGTAWTETMGMQIVERFISKRRTVTIGCSHAAIQAAKRIGVTGSSPTVVIPDGVDLERCIAKSSGNLRQELGLNENQRILLILGRLVGTKGHALAVEALLSLPDSVHMVIAGDGPMRPSIEKFADEVGVGARVHFLGFRHDIAELLASADLLVAPSIHDSRSGAAPEAMAAGLPVVASKVDGLPEVVEDGVTGILVPLEVRLSRWMVDRSVPDVVYDPDSRRFVERRGPSPKLLAEAISTLLGDEQMRRTMGARGKAKVEDEMELGKVARSQEQVYLKALSGGYSSD